MGEIRHYEGTCGACGKTHRHTVEIKADRSIRLPDSHLPVVCCTDHPVMLGVVECRIARRFDRLRRLFEPEPLGAPLTPAQRASAERDLMIGNAMLDRGGRPWGM